VVGASASAAWPPRAPPRGCTASTEVTKQICATVDQHGCLMAAAVVYDLDGTLLDTENLACESTAGHEMYSPYLGSHATLAPASAQGKQSMPR
jgi:hypothetical protein